MPHDNRESRKLIGEILAVWGDLYKIEISKMTVVTYCSALEDYTPEELRYAANIITKNHKYKSLPLPGNFTEIIKIERKESIYKNQTDTTRRRLLEVPKTDPVFNSALARLSYTLIGSKLSKEEIEAKFKALREKFDKDPEGLKAELKATKSPMRIDMEKTQARRDAMMNIVAKDKADFIKQTEEINKQFGVRSNQ